MRIRSERIQWLYALGALMGVACGADHRALASEPFVQVDFAAHDTRSMHGKLPEFVNELNGTWDVTFASAEGFLAPDPVRIETAYLKECYRSFAIHYMNRGTEIFYKFNVAEWGLHFTYFQVGNLIFSGQMRSDGNGAFRGTLVAQSEWGEISLLAKMVRQSANSSLRSLRSQVQFKLKPVRIGSRIYSQDPKQALIPASIVRAPHSDKHLICYSFNEVWPDSTSVRTFSFHYPNPHIEESRLRPPMPAVNDLGEPGALTFDWNYLWKSIRPFALNLWIPGDWTSIEFSEQ